MWSLIRRILNHFRYYKISDLKVGGHCGCCGAWIPDLITVENDNWAWGICEKCLKD